MEKIENILSVCSGYREGRCTATWVGGWICTCVLISRSHYFLCETLHVHVYVDIA